jgi:hypothetical protein
MLNKRVQVIRKKQIQNGPPYVLPSGRYASSGGASGRSDSCSPGEPAQARIVESNSDYVILEMVCGCGRKSFVQCNYGNVAGSQSVQESRS